MKQAYNMDETGFTLIELLVVLLTLSIILISVPAVFKGGTQVWEKGDRHAEVLQNSLIGMEQVTRELKQAKYVTAVSTPSDTSGYIEFKYKDGAIGKYQRYGAADGYLQHAWSNDEDIALSGILQKSAGPIDSLTFACYKYVDNALAALDLGATDLAKEMKKTRLVKIQMSTYDEQGKINSVPLSSWIYIRGWSTSRADDFAIFGNDGVDIGRNPTIVGDHSDSNIGANGDIIIGNKLDFRSGETHHGGGGELIIDPPGNPSLDDNPDYGWDEIILLPCITDFTPWSSGTIDDIPRVMPGEVSERPRFSVGLGYEADLDAGIFPAALGLDFEDNGFPLSGDITVSVDTIGSDWRIDDNVDGLVYNVHKVGSELKIYEEVEGRDILEGSYSFLDIRNNGIVNLFSGTYYFGSIEALNNVTINLDVTGGDITVYVEGSVVVGNALSEFITMDPVAGGGAQNIYFETHYGDPLHSPADDPDVAAWSMGGNALWSGTIYAPYGDIDVTDGVIEGQLLSGGTVTVHGGAPSILDVPEKSTYIDFVLSNYIRDYGYVCYDEW